MFRLFRALLAVTAVSVFAYSQADGEGILFKDGFEDPPTKLIHRWTFSENGGSGTPLIDDIGGAGCRMPEKTGVPWVDPHVGPRFAVA